MKPATKRICLSLLSSLTLTAGYHVTAQTKPSVARDLDPIPSSLDVRAEASLSITRGILKVERFRDPVDVLRDRWGVAHIYAYNQHDLFFAQGFVTAQDRLFQMELWKRAGQGRSPMVSTLTSQNAQLPEAVDFRSNFKLLAFNLSRGGRPTV